MVTGRGPDNPIALASFQSPIAPRIGEYPAAVRGQVADLDAQRIAVKDHAAEFFYHRLTKNPRFPFSHAHGAVNSDILQDVNSHQVRYVLEGSQAGVLGNAPKYAELGEGFEHLGPFDVAVFLRRPHLERQAGNPSTAEPTILWVRGTEIAVARPWNNITPDIPLEDTEDDGLYPLTIFVEPGGIAVDDRRTVLPIPLMDYTDNPRLRRRIITTTRNDIAAAATVLEKMGTMYGPAPEVETNFIR